MKKVKNKGFIGIALVILIASVIIGGGAYYYSQSKAEVSVVGNEIKNWETYTNEKYGFEFKYPGNYEITEETEELSNEKEKTGVIMERHAINVYVKPHGSLTFYILPYDAATNLLEMSYDGPGGAPAVYSYKSVLDDKKWIDENSNIEIDGHKAYFKEHIWGDDDPGPYHEYISGDNEPGEFASLSYESEYRAFFPRFKLTVNAHLSDMYIYSPDDEGFYGVGIAYKDREAQRLGLKKLSPIIDKIISTFKFTN